MYMEDNIKTEKQPIENSASEQIPPTSNVLEPKPKHRPPIIVTIIILFLLVVGTASAYLYFQRSMTKTVGTLCDPCENWSSPTPDPTANWKTYTNNSASFSIKYDPLWKITDNNKTVFYNGNPSWEVKFNITEGTDLYINISENGNFKNDEDYLNFYKKEFSYGSGLNSGNSEEIKVDGINALLTKESKTPTEKGQKGEPPFWHTEVFAFNDGKTYDILLKSDLKSGNQEPLLKQILSTFKFINKQESGNELNKFISYKIPEGWSDVTKPASDSISIEDPNYYSGSSDQLGIAIYRSTALGNLDYYKNLYKGANQVKGNTVIDNEPAIIVDMNYEGHSLDYDVIKNGFMWYISFQSAGHAEQKYNKEIQEFIKSIKFK